MRNWDPDSNDFYIAQVAIGVALFKRSLWFKKLRSVPFGSKGAWLTVARILVVKMKGLYSSAFL